MFPYGEDMMKQWYENWEKMMGASLEKMVQNDKFVQEMSRAIAATMSGKAQYSRLVDEQLAAMNLPTRTDMVKALQKLTDLEERLISMQEAVEDLQDEYRRDLEKLRAELVAGPAGEKTSAKKTTAPVKSVQVEKPAVKKAGRPKKATTTKKTPATKATGVRKTTRKG